MSPALITLLTALAAAAAVAGLARWRHLGELRTVTGALTAAVLAGLLANELADAGAAQWWARHPLTAAVLTGVLVLAGTLLIVEALIARRIEEAENRRWLPVASAAATNLLADLAEPLHRLQREVIWPGTEFAESFERRGRYASPDVTQECAAAIRRAVLAAAPGLTGTDRIHDVFQHALDGMEDAEVLVWGHREWDRESQPDLGLAWAGSESARLAWWGVVAQWQRLDTSMTRFWEQATWDLHANPADDDGEPLWRDHDDTFAKSCREHEHEFDDAEDLSVERTDARTSVPHSLGRSATHAQDEI